MSEGEKKPEGEKIVQVNIEQQMKSAYIDYSMSVIVSRALPDVRDGLKPVHRRILYAMWDMGVYYGKPYKKSARIVGDVLGKYHPHGDTAVYDSMVRMAQKWSLRYTFVDGQGNFGSVDGDSPAAMRYTEARMMKIAEEMLEDIQKDTVSFEDNFDGSLQEPRVLPAKVPSLLINGSSGIAVGMATNMAPHNLSEVCDGICAYIDNNEITIEELMQYIKAPDFPTSCIVCGDEGIRNAFETGRGRIMMRGNATIDDKDGRTTITVTSLPYMVNPSEMIRRTVELIKDDKIDGISNIENLSNGKNGTKIVYELKRDAVPRVILNKLYQYTALQSSFSVNNIALVNGRPMSLNLKDIIVEFVKHRHEVIVRRTQFDLKKAQERMHIVEGLLKALDIIDEIIAVIRGSKTVEDARNTLIERWQFSEIQAQEIVNMRLRQLVGLELQKLKDEYDELLKKIEEFNRILGDRALRMQIIKDETAEIKEKYGDERRSEIDYTASNFRVEDTIPDEEVVITISRLGYIKRTPLTEYKAQRKGGKGSRGSAARDEDFIEHLYMATNHNYLLFFTEKGKCFWLRVFEVPEGNKTSKGRAIANLLSMDPDDKIKAVINVNNLSDSDYINNNYIILCTDKGIIKKTSLEAYSRPRVNGIIAITIREDDQLLEARLTNGECEVMMALNSGRAARFNEKTVRPMGRNASGVKGITLANENDRVIGMICVESQEGEILVVSENGYGKRSLLEEYRVTNRGAKGVKTINITEKTGSLISIQSVTDNDDLMIINKSGIAIRLHIDSLRVIGRVAQGVRLINLKETDAIAAVALVPREEEEEEIIDTEGEVITDENNTSETVETTETTEDNQNE